MAAKAISGGLKPFQGESTPAVKDPTPPFWKYQQKLEEQSNIRATADTKEAAPSRAARAERLTNRTKRKAPKKIP